MEKVLFVVISKEIDFPLLSHSSKWKPKNDISSMPTNLCTFPHFRWIMWWIRSYVRHETYFFFFNAKNVLFNLVRTLSLFWIITNTNNTSHYTHSTMPTKQQELSNEMFVKQFDEIFKLWLQSLRAWTNIGLYVELTNTRTIFSTFF